jgi:transposase
LALARGGPERDGAGCAGPERARQARGRAPAAQYAINPKRLNRLRDRTSVAGAKDDRRDARVAAAGLRTDPHLFRRVVVGDPAVVELREWSRLAEELQQERVRLANRIRQQLWRYYPQLLELADDVTAEWILELWSLAPTPAKAARLREATLARLLQRHRIRKLDAASLLGVLLGLPSRWPRA